jgi:hypothetical protein
MNCWFLCPVQVSTNVNTQHVSYAHPATCTCECGLTVRSPLCFFSHVNVSLAVPPWAKDSTVQCSHLHWANRSQVFKNLILRGLNDKLYKGILSFETVQSYYTPLTLKLIFTHKLKICICYHGNSNYVSSVVQMSYGCCMLLGIILALHWTFS